MYTSNKLSKAIRLAIAFGAVSTLAFASAVSAQDSANDEEKATEIKPERIQILGSRIRTDNFGSATPVDILTTDMAETQGLVTLGDLLRTSTIAAGSNQITSALTVGFNQDGGTGSETISLRGLGANRTLVLLNGRRAGPAGTRGGVSSFDLNTLPISIIESIEILKDGASSLYGSDAVAGVINIITKKGDESTINVYGSKPEESGGESYSANITFGKTFDRGSFRVLADYKKTRELTRGDRDYYGCAERYIFDPVTGEQADPIDPRTGKAHCNDLAWGMWMYDDDAPNYKGTIAQYDYDGSLAAIGAAPYASTGSALDVTTPAGWYPVGYDAQSDGYTQANHPFLDRETFVPENDVVSLYAQGDYDINDNISGYFEALHSKRKTVTNSFRQFWHDAAFYTPLYGAELPASGAGWDGAVLLDPTVMTDHSGSKTTVDYSRIVLGLEGSLGDYFWDVSYQYSHNKGVYENAIIFKDSLMSSGQAAQGFSCNGSTPISNRACVTVPWFDPHFINGDMSQEVKDYLFGWDKGETIYKQQTIEAYLTGDLFELPAGMIGFAVGTSFQRDEIEDTPGFHTQNGNTWGSTSAGITAGDSDTTAFFGEVNVPLLADLPLVESLDLSLSARYTDVSTYGNDTTYKAGLNWAMGGGFRVRASRGSSFRSPALFELFLKDQTSYVGQGTIDPCQNWFEKHQNGTLIDRVAENCAKDVPENFVRSISSAQVTTKGGAGKIIAETSVSEILGLVWTSADNNIAASIDYYSIKISDEITQLSAAQVVGGCYNSESFESEPLCDLFNRLDGTNDDWGIDNVDSTYVNIATQVVKGLDIGMSYIHDLSFAQLAVDYKHTIQLTKETRLFENSAPIENISRTGFPKHVGNLNTTLRFDDWRITWNAQIVGTTDPKKYLAKPTTNYRGNEYDIVSRTPTTIYHSLSASVDMNDNLDITFGFANLFDKAPPKVTSGVTGYRQGTSVMQSQYDPLGRRLFVNLTYSF